MVHIPGSYLNLKGNTCLTQNSCVQGLIHVWLRHCDIVLKPHRKRSVHLMHHTQNRITFRNCVNNNTNCEKVINFINSLVLGIHLTENTVKMLCSSFDFEMMEAHGHIFIPNIIRCYISAILLDGMNAVIVVSDVLEKYIRKNYPNYRIVSSTCKQIRDFDQLCEELEKDYTLVVLDYNWNNNWEMLEKLPHKDRVEILVNAVCEPNCPRRGDHYKFLGRTQIGYVEHLQKEGPYKPYKLQEQFDCPHMGRMIYDITHHCTHVTPQDIYEKYVPMGFTNFKIEGRSSLAINVVETYLYYMVKPEHRDRMRMYFLLSMNQSGIIEFKD